MGPACPATMQLRSCAARAASRLPLRCISIASRWQVLLPCAQHIRQHHTTKLVNATKQLLVHRSPPVLALQLKRFGYGRHGGGKIGRPVTFDERLDLAPDATARKTLPRARPCGSAAVWAGGRVGRAFSVARRVWAGATRRPPAVAAQPQKHILI